MQEHHNLSVGDVVLLYSHNKYSRDRYKLARVLASHPDECGRVRTLTVGFRVATRPLTEDMTATDVRLKELRVPAQRLVLILPVEEQGLGRDDSENEEDVPIPETEGMPATPVVERWEHPAEGVTEVSGSEDGDGIPDSEVESVPASRPTEQQLSAEEKPVVPMPQRRNTRRRFPQSHRLQVQVPEEVPGMKDL